MKKSKIALLLVLSLLVSTAVSCGSESSGASNKTVEENSSEPLPDRSNPTGTTTIIVTGNVHGQLDPCG